MALNLSGGYKVDYEKSNKILVVLERLIEALNKNGVQCEKILLIANLMRAKKVVSVMDIRQKIMLDMRPVYDNWKSTKEIDDLLEEIYTLTD